MEALGVVLDKFGLGVALACLWRSPGSRGFTVRFGKHMADDRVAHVEMLSAIKDNTEELKEIKENVRQSVKDGTKERKELAEEGRDGRRELHGEVQGTRGAHGAHRIEDRPACSQEAEDPGPPEDLITEGGGYAALKQRG